MNVRVGKMTADQRKTYLAEIDAAVLKAAQTIAATGAYVKSDDVAALFKQGHQLTAAQVKDARLRLQKSGLWPTTGKMVRAKSTPKPSTRPSSVLGLSNVARQDRAKEIEDLVLAAANQALSDGDSAMITTLTEAINQGNQANPARQVTQAQVTYARRKLILQGLWPTKSKSVSPRFIGPFAADMARIRRLRRAYRQRGQAP